MPAIVAMSATGHGKTPVTGIALIVVLIVVLAVVVVSAVALIYAWKQGNK